MIEVHVKFYLSQIDSLIELNNSKCSLVDEFRIQFGLTLNDFDSFRMSKNTSIFRLLQIRQQFWIQNHILIKIFVALKHKMSSEVVLCTVLNPIDKIHDIKTFIPNNSENFFQLRVKCNFVITYWVTQIVQIITYVKFSCYFTY